MKMLPIKFLSIFFLLHFFGFACQTEQKEQIPKGILPPDKMESFLYDIHEAEAKILYAGLPQDTATALFRYMEKQVFKKHKVDTAQVYPSLAYYNQHPELLDSIYAKLLKKVGP
jgi:hypothetical protein